MEDFIFNSDVLYTNLNFLRKTYAFIEINSIGKSVLGKDIPYVRIGCGQKEVFYSASFHANEWITSVVLLKFLHEYSNSIQNNYTILDIPAKCLFDNCSIYIVPMVNPDGVDLVTGAISPSSSTYKHAQNIANNFPSIPFVDGWKANIRGVDLKNFLLSFFK